MNFISNIISSIIQFIITLILNVCSLVFAPIYGIVTALFPSLEEYLQMVVNFFINTICPYMAFIREIFFNITGASRILYTILIGFWLSFFTIATALRVWNLIFNTYCLIRGIPPKGKNQRGYMVE